MIIINAYSLYCLPIVGGYQGVRRTPDYSIIARVTAFEGFILGQQSSSLPISSLKIEYEILVGLAVLELLIKTCKLLF